MMKGWTREAVIKAQLKHGVCNLTESDFEKPGNEKGFMEKMVIESKIVSAMPLDDFQIKNYKNAGKMFIERTLIAARCGYSREFKFHPDRKYKFDWILMPILRKVAIEYEGLVFNNNRQKSTGKSGHVTVSGYTSNCEKYNLATVNGWRVLRYTAMNYKSFEPDLQKILALTNAHPTP